MMSFIDIYSDANEERSGHIADLIGCAGVRFEQRVVTEAGRPIHIIAVHPDHRKQAADLLSDLDQREREAFVGTLTLVRQTFTAQDMLFAREPNEAGYFVSGVYDGESFDETKFELVQGGWDHEHCYLCAAKVEPGDVWWAAQPPNYLNQAGLCVECHVRRFGSE